MQTKTTQSKPKRNQPVQIHKGVDKKHLTVSVNVYPTELLSRWNSDNHQKPVVYARLKNQSELNAFEHLVAALGVSKAEFIARAITNALSSIKNTLRA